MSLHRLEPRVTACRPCPGGVQVQQPSSPESGTPVAASASAKAPAPAPAPAPATAPAPAPAPTPAPATGPAVSFLRPADPERCDWVRQPLPSGEAVTVFSFSAACDRSMVSWSPDGKQGLVFTWPSGEGEVPKAWRVDLVAHKGQPLDLKTLPGGTGAGEQDQPAIDELGFDKQGRPVALIQDAYVTRTPEKGPDGKEFMTFEGKHYPVTGAEGGPGLAHAYRLEEGGWKRFETVATAYGSDLAPGTSELEASKGMQPIAKASPPQHNLGEEAPAAAVKKLDKAFPGMDESGQWMKVSTPGGPLYYRGTLGGEFLYRRRR